jgi:hypothetical protein
MTATAPKRWEVLLVGAECSGKSLFIKGLQAYFQHQQSGPFSNSSNNNGNLSSRSINFSSSVINTSNSEYDNCNDLIPIGTYLPPTVGVDITDITINMESIIPNPSASISPSLAAPSLSAKLTSSAISPKNSNSRKSQKLMSEPSVNSISPSTFSIDLQVRELGAAISSRWASYYHACDCLIFVFDLSDVAQWATSAIFLAEVLIHQDTLLHNKPILIVLNRAEECDSLTQSAALQLLGVGQLVPQYSQPTPHHRNINSSFISLLFASAGRKDGIKELAESIEKLVLLYHPRFQPTGTEFPLDNNNPVESTAPGASTT